MIVFPLANANASIITATTTAESLLSLIDTSGATNHNFRAGLDAADINVEDGDIRIMFDCLSSGLSPTTTKGFLIKQGSTYLIRRIPLSGIKIVSTTGTVSCSVQIGISEEDESSGLARGGSSGEVTAGTGISVTGSEVSIDETVVTLAGTQTLTNKTLTSPSITTPTGIVKGDVGLGNADDTSDATKNSATATLTNKRITARVQSVADAATVTPNADTNDCVDITAIAQAFTIANPTGTPTNFQKLNIRIKDNGTARAITFGDGYVAGGVALPTTTVLSKILNLGFIYNTANSLNKWQLVASAQEA